MRSDRPSRASSDDMSDNSQPATDPKIAAVQRLYAAYGRGDIDAVLAELADDVDWAAEAASTSVPWYGAYRGKSEVPRFFKEIGSNVEVTEFTLVSLTSNETDVIATVRWAYTRERDRQDAPRCTCSTGGASPTARSSASAARRTPSSPPQRSRSRRRGRLRRTPTARPPGGSVHAERGRRTTKQQPTSPFCTVSTP